MQGEPCLQSGDARRALDVVEICAMQMEGMLNAIRSVDNQVPRSDGMLMDT